MIAEYPKLIPAFRISEEMWEALQGMNNRSEYIRKALEIQLRKDGKLKKEEKNNGN